MYNNSSCRNCILIFVLLVNSLLLAATMAACQSFKTSSLLQPYDTLPSVFSLSSACNGVDVDAIQDSMSDLGIARDAESLETIFASFDGDSLDGEGTVDSEMSEVVRAGSHERARRRDF